MSPKVRVLIRRTKRTGSPSARGVANHFDFFSVLDVEGVAQRPVEVRACLEVEATYCLGVEERDWDRDQVVATDHAPLRQTLGPSNLHLASDTADGPCDRRTGDG